MTTITFLCIYIGLASVVLSTVAQQPPWTALPDEIGVCCGCKKILTWDFTPAPLPNVLDVAYLQLWRTGSGYPARLLWWKKPASSITVYSPFNKSVTEPGLKVSIAARAITPDILPPFTVTLKNLEMTDAGKLSFQLVADNGRGLLGLVPPNRDINLKLIGADRCRVGMGKWNDTLVNEIKCIESGGNNSKIHTCTSHGSQYEFECAGVAPYCLWRQGAVYGTIIASLQEPYSLNVSGINIIINADCTTTLVVTQQPDTFALGQTEKYCYATGVGFCIDYTNCVDLPIYGVRTTPSVYTTEATDTDNVSSSENDRQLRTVEITVSYYQPTPIRTFLLDGASACGTGCYVGILLGFIVLLGLCLVGICYYKMKCKKNVQHKEEEVHVAQSQNKHEMIDKSSDNLKGLRYSQQETKVNLTKNKKMYTQLRSSNAESLETDKAWRSKEKRNGII